MIELLRDVFDIREKTNVFYYVKRVLVVLKSFKFKADICSLEYFLNKIRRQNPVYGCTSLSKSTTEQSNSP